jgi:DNA-binding NtrC family response regulator
MITAYAEYARAVEAVKAGAFHYLSKPFEFSALLEVLRRATDSATGEGGSCEPSAIAALLGKSRSMQELKSRLMRVAQSPVETVLVRGESGTGKELVARALHVMSDRADAPFVSVNCAALTETLLMSELFGHERGAFTDAREQKKGVFETADHGTLFLDEIGEMDPQSQAALLRVLEQRTVRRVGGTANIPVDIRVVAATNRDLGALVRAGRFRPDLYYRLNVVEVVLPPLRTRGDDVLLLAQHFSERAAARYREAVRPFTPRAEAVLRTHAWPGNVRELRNAVERAYAASAQTFIDRNDLGLQDGTLPTEVDLLPDLMESSFQDAKQQVIDLFERHYLEEALARSEGNITRAADDAGVLRQVFQRLLRRHGIAADPYRHQPPTAAT